MVVLRLAMKIAGFLDNSRTDTYAGTSDFFFWRENISEGNRFGGKSFGVECLVLQTLATLL